jgi:hypothetical protein
MTQLMTCQSKDLLLAYLYDDTTQDERQAVEAHLADCAECRAEAEDLTGVRAALTAWDAPTLSTHLRVVAEKPRTQSPRRWWTVPAFAAAAVLVLAAAAGLARLEVRYDANGFAVQTGVSASPASAGSLPTALDRSGRGDAEGTPWRTELTALEKQLRREFADAHAGLVPAASNSNGMAPVSSRTSDQEVLKRVQQLIDESEIRQQRNLALRMTEVSRDFSLQRQADLVQIQQGFGRLEGRTEAEAARARELMNYILRVSQQESPPK